MVKHDSKKDISTCQAQGLTSNFYVSLNINVNRAILLFVLQ